MKKESRFKKIVSGIFDFLTTFITTLVVIVAIAFVAIRLLGWEMYSVDSYSMTPAYPIDSLIVVQTVDASEIEVGDVITFVLNEEGTLVTHRVVSISTSDRTFTTKGDANSSNDASPVRWENVIGKVVIGVPFLGKPLRYLTAEENRTMVIAAIVALLALSFLWDRLSSMSQKKRERKAAREAELRESEGKADGEDGLPESKGKEGGEDELPEIEGKADGEDGPLEIEWVEDGENGPLDGDREEDGAAARENGREEGGKARLKSGLREIRPAGVALAEEEWDDDAVGETEMQESGEESVDIEALESEIVKAAEKLQESGKTGETGKKQENEKAGAARETRESERASAAKKKAGTAEETQKSEKVTVPEIAGEKRIVVTELTKIAEKKRPMEKSESAPKYVPWISEDTRDAYGSVDEENAGKTEEADSKAQEVEEILKDLEIVRWIDEVR